MEHQDYSFIVSPMSQRISLKAGDTYTGSIKVANPKSATKDFKFKVVLSPYSIVDDNYTRDFATVSDWSRIVEWMDLETTGGTIKPNEVKEVNFTIKIPEDAPGGGQYAAIIVSSDQDASNFGGELIKDTYEMASILYVGIEGETKHEGEIITNSIPGFVTVGKPATSVTVSNLGNVHEVLTTKLSIKNLFTGQQILPIEDDEGDYENIIMPSTTREVTRELSDVPTLGIFEVKQQLSYLDQTSEVTTIMVVCPIWFIVLVIATILSIISMIFYGRHLKKKHAQKKDSNLQ